MTWAGIGTITFTVSVAASTPTESEGFALVCPSNTLTGSPGYISITPCALPVTPTITSIEPSGFFAGGSTNITITGSGFIPGSNANNCISSSLAVTAGTENVALSNISVVSPTQITATVAPQATDPAEAATVAVSNYLYNGNGQNPPSYYASSNSLPAEILPIPKITLNGNVISGNAKTQTAVVGQPVVLQTTPSSLPNGYTIVRSTWSIDGTNIETYSASAAGIVLGPIQTDSLNSTFYWIYPGTGLKVNYYYCAQDPTQNVICSSPTATATFNAKMSGTPTLKITEDYKKGTIEQLNVCNDQGQVTGTQPFLGYGNLKYPTGSCSPPFTGTPGIELTASGASSGSYTFVQVIVSDSRTYTYPAGNGYTCGPYSGLDTSYPYMGLLSSSVAEDGPQIPLPSTYATANRNFTANMYLLWQPPQLSSTTLPSIPVPVGYQQWQFIATTTQNQPIGSDVWQTPTTAAHGAIGGFIAAQPTDNDWLGYPFWTGLSSTGCD